MATSTLLPVGRPSEHESGQATACRLPYRGVHAAPLTRVDRLRLVSRSGKFLTSCAVVAAGALVPFAAMPAPWVSLLLRGGSSNSSDQTLATASQKSNRVSSIASKSPSPVSG